MRRVGTSTNGSTVRLTSASRQSFDHDEQQAERGERLAEQVGQDVGDGHLDLFDVVHDRRHQAAGGVGFEELGALLQHLVEDRLRRSVTAENPT